MAVHIVGTSYSRAIGSQKARCDHEAEDIARHWFMIALAGWYAMEALLNVPECALCG